MEKMLLSTIAHMSFVQKLGGVIPKVLAFLGRYDFEKILALLAPAAKVGQAEQAKADAESLIVEAKALEADLETLFKHK